MQDGDSICRMRVVSSGGREYLPTRGLCFSIYTNILSQIYIYIVLNDNSFFAHKKVICQKSEIIFLYMLIAKSAYKYIIIYFYLSI